MTISELICRLQAIKCEHGDLEVAVVDEFGDFVDAKSVFTAKSKTVLGDMPPYVVIKQSTPRPRG